MPPVVVLARAKADCGSIGSSASAQSAVARPWNRQEGAARSASVACLAAWWYITLSVADSKKKQRELCLARRVVAVRGGGEVAEETSAWPDAWLVPADGGEHIPMEVVAAPPRPDSEPTNAGSRMVREQKAAEQRQGELVRQGIPALVFSNYETVTVVVPGERAPLAAQPMQPVTWVLAAIRQKREKNYDQAARTILVVDGLQMMPVEPWELRKLAAECDPFPEVWFCPEVSNDVVQRVR